jgi:DNA ligase (NAD+)
MDKKQAEKRIRALREEVEKNRYFYHVLDKPRVSDAVDDSLKHELKDLEERYPELVTADSPTQRVGGEPLSKFQKVTHETPMLSLNDVFNLEELRDWECRLMRLVGKKELSRYGYYCELKMDGLAVSLKYKNGVLLQGSTRGNGKVGEDVTSNLKTINSIPLSLKDCSIRTIYARGEVYLTKKEFKKLNELQAKKGGQIFANSRNIAAGSIRQLNPKITASRDLKFMLYSLDGFNFELHSQEHEKAEKLGFKANVKNNKLCRNIEEVYRYYKLQERKRDSLDYQIDGIVVGINNKNLFAKLGVAGKAPRGQIAFKFPAEEATSVIKDIVIQIGRTGKLTPVALLEPTFFAGSKVSRATLHNKDEIDRKDIRIGDTVIIRKAGDVIPEVVEPIKRMRSGNERPFEMPKECPICGGSIKKRKGEVDWYCKDKNCSVRRLRSIIHFASKAGFDIEGLGPKILQQLFSQGLVKDASDIFKLKEDDLKPLERFAEKSAANLVFSIKQSKKIELDRFIYALGIRHIGDQTAIDLAKHFRDLKSFRKVRKEDLKMVYGIGTEVAESVYQYFQNKENQDLIDGFLKQGVKVRDYDSPIVKNKLGRKSFVVTGSLPTLTRTEVHKKIVQYGGEVSSSVTSKTDYLIVGEDPGSKIERAKKFNTKIISEEEFKELIS